MSPFESAIAAARIAGDLETPWVADLRDPWALDEVQVYPTRLHHKLELFRMRTALSTAAAVIMNTSEAAARLVRQFPEFKGKIVVSIPNGFDPEDFEGSSPPREGDAYRIVHTGYLHTDAHRHSGLVRTLRGGAMPGVNMKARSHIYLLEAIRRVSERHPELVSRVELHLAGVVSEADRAPLPPDLARVHGYLSHASAVALMRSADLLFLPMHDLPPGQRAGIVPGKTYEYLATGVPILAAVPDGDARDLLARSSNTFICQPTDVAAMEAFLTETLSLGRPRRVQSGDRPAFLERYERRHLAEELAAVLDRVLGQRLRAHSSRE
jgi:glycosyltransferase involved in cell wall biosynthesis